jgi:hypothetical protein
LARVRNRRLYREYLHGAVAELLGLLDLAWAQRPAAVEVTLAQTPEVQLQILLNLPPGTERLRLAILQRLEHGLKEECYAAEARRGGRTRRQMTQPDVRNLKLKKQSRRAAREDPKMKAMTHIEGMLLQTYLESCPQCRLESREPWESRPLSRLAKLRKIPTWLTA